MCTMKAPHASRSAKAVKNCFVVEKDFYTEGLVASVRCIFGAEGDKII